MDEPFFRGFNRTDLIFVATVAKALAADDFHSIDESFGSLGAGVTSHRKGSTYVPDVYLYISDTLIVILVQGTEGVGQLIGQALQSFNEPTFQFDGSTMRFFNTATLHITADIDAVVRPRLADRKLVCMGFSLGGAVAQLLGSYYRNVAVKGLSVICLGAPRVGNANFATAMDPFVWRLDAERDPVPTVPPETWGGPGSAFPVSGTGPISNYKHSGQAATLENDGTIVLGDDLIPIDQVVKQFVTGSVPTHQTAWYLAALLSKSDLSTYEPGEEGYIAPSDLYEQTQVQQGLPISGRPQEENFSMPSQLVQGLLYFRDSAVSEGWSESVYYVGDIPGMNMLLSSLVTPRSLFLANDCEIHAYRSAYVGGSKLSQTTKYPSPQVGQTSEGVNECGDAILYNYKSATNAHRQLTFRAVPDGAIGGNKLTPIGTALLASIDSYCLALRNGGVGLKVPDATVLVQQIVSLANVVPGGPLQITSALAHGLTTGDQVNIAGLRGFPYLLGKWKIAVQSATTFTLNGSQRYNATLGAEGTFQGIEYVLQTASSFGFNMVAFRKTGRPFGQPRGKRSKRLLRS
jgi:pimeloyl-ACP methyl ester carboxylesterase